MPVNCDINHKNFPCRQLTGHGRLRKQNCCPRTDSETKNKISQKFFDHTTHTHWEVATNKNSPQRGAWCMGSRWRQLHCGHNSAQLKIVSIDNCKNDLQTLYRTLFKFENMSEKEIGKLLFAALAVFHHCPVQFAQPKSILFQCLSIMTYAYTHTHTHKHIRMPNWLVDEWSQNEL